VGGGFPALGVRVVNVLVEGDRGPVLRHFDQMVAVQQPPDEERVAEHRGSHVVRQPQPPQGVGPFADKVFDHLEKRPRRIVAQQHVQPLDHLAAERLKRGEPLFHRRNSGLEGIEQPQHGPGHANGAGVDQLADSARVQVSGGGGRSAAAVPPGGDRLVHRLDQLIVRRVEQKFRFLKSHMLNAPGFADW